MSIAQQIVRQKLGIPPPMDDLRENDAVNNAALINSFCEITSSTREEALFYLESHQFNLDSAVSTFLDSNHANYDHVDPPLASIPTAPSNRAVNSSSPSSSTPSESQSPNYSPSQSPSRSRSRSPSPAPSRARYRLRSSGKKPAKAATGSGSGKRGGIRTLSDLNRKPEVAPDSEDDDDDYEPQQFYTGGEKSGMLVQDPSKHYDADAVFDQARNSGEPSDYRSSSSSVSFTGTGRLLSGGTVPSAPKPPEPVQHTVTLWGNGFTVDGGPLRRFDDPANASFLESIKKSECPLELEPKDRKTQVHLELMRREENYSEPERRRQTSFHGVGRTIGSSTSSSAEKAEATSPTSRKAAPLPAVGLVVDSSLPTTSIQLRLADGTRMVSRFNLHHTISDIRGFIEASRPGGGRDYQLQTMGFPPKQLTDPKQTIEEAGIASSVVIQKF